MRFGNSLWGVLLGGSLVTLVPVTSLAQAPSPRCPSCVFGPQVYKRLPGAPRQDVATFGADPNADYLIEIDEAGGQGADATVTLNGKTLLSPRTGDDCRPLNVNRRRRYVRVAVILRLRNTLVVTLTGRPGSTLKVSVLGGTKSVGAAGGTVTAPGGGVRLEIPPDALSQDTEVSISPANGFRPLAVLDGATPLGGAWALEPKGLVFEQPVTMSINYSNVLGQVASSDEIGVVHSDDGGTFVEPLSAVDDPSAQVLTFSLKHFSLVSIVKASTGYNTYRMHWSIAPFGGSLSFEEKLWAEPTLTLNHTTANGARISVLHSTTSGSSFACPSQEPFQILDQTGMTCMPTPGLGVERVLDQRSHVTIVLFDGQITNPGEASTALLHQLGHALGIAHPWRLPHDLWWTNPDVFPVMSSLWWTGLPTGPKLVRNTLHPLDIAAIQSKYGVRPLEACYPNLSPPDLAFTDTSDSQGLTYYWLTVTNRSAFPDDLFGAAPDLPPCGLNTAASRTWLSVYAIDGSYLYGYCAMESSSDLARFWVAFPTGELVPSVYVTMQDRRCNRSYTSAPVQLQPPPGSVRLSGRFSGTYAWDCGGSRTGSTPIIFHLTQAGSQVTGTAAYLGGVSNISNGFFGTFLGQPDFVQLTVDASPFAAFNEFRGALSGVSISGTTLNGDSSSPGGSGCSALSGPSGSFSVTKQ